MTDKPTLISQSPEEGIMDKTIREKTITSHFDLTNMIEIIAPAAVAITIVVSYLTQVIITGNTDSELGSSLPVIVSAYFILHVSTANKRNV